MHTTPMIEFACSNCGRLLKASQDNAGRQCRCRKCNQENTIPQELDEVLLLQNRTDYVPMIRIFIVACAVAWTVISLLLLAMIFTDQWYIHPTDKWATIGTILGLWVGSLVTFAETFLISEIVIALRKNRH